MKSATASGSEITQSPSFIVHTEPRTA